MNIDEMISQLMQERSKDNTYPFIECEYRNMVLIGRTRTGKSTISNMIRDPFHIPELPSLFSGTRVIDINRIMANHEGNAYFFTVIDSPGLFDCVRKESEHISNERIKTLLDTCITKDITHIHAFAFVFSSIAGINREDIQSMIFVQKNYPSLGKFFMLIITHCEEKSLEEREQFMKDFFQHPDVIQHKLEKFFALGIYFTGALRPQLLNDPNLIAARNQIGNVLDMRKKLLDYLILRKTTYNIHYVTDGLIKRMVCYPRYIIVVLIVLIAILSKLLF